MRRKPFPFLLLALVALAAPALAETRAGLVMRPMPAGKIAELKFEIDQYLESDTDAGFDHDMRVFAARGRVRLFPERERRSPLLGWDVLHIDTDTADPRIPEQLTGAAVALGFGLPAGDWILNVTVGAGFAGDEPFDGRGWYGLASVTATRRFDERDTLTLGLDFDGNRPVFPDVPLPVAVWIRKWGDTLRTSIGFPFLGITWEPTTWFTFTFRGIPGLFQTGSATFHVHDDIDIFVRYRGANFRFFLDGSPGGRRLFYSEQRVELGVTATFQDVEVTLVVGWALDREFSTGWDLRDDDVFATLDETVLFGLTITIRF